MKYYALSGADIALLSHPSRVCGLKFKPMKTGREPTTVTPFTGVWIEIPINAPGHPYRPVTPFTGVWIEMALQRTRDSARRCHTLHGCVD